MPSPRRCCRRSTAGPPNVEATLGIASTREMAVLLSERLADVALGPALAGPHAPGVVSEPLLRYRLLLIAGNDHPLHVDGVASLRALRNEAWLVDPSGHRPAVRRRPAARRRRRRTRRRCACSRRRRRPGRRRRPVAASPRRSSSCGTATRTPRLARCRSAGCRWTGCGTSTLLQGDRRSATAARLHRFLATPDATQAMFRADGGVPASQFRPPVYVTIWS